MAIGLFNRVLSFTTSAIGSSKTARSLKKKTYWVQAQKLFKYDVELLEAWEKAILENAQDWELHYFYGSMTQYWMIESLDTIYGRKLIDKTEIKYAKRRYKDPNRYTPETSKVTDPDEIEELREENMRSIFRHKDNLKLEERWRQIIYRDIAKLCTMQGISGFERFLSAHNPIHPYKYHPDLEKLGKICLNPDDLPKAKRKELEEEYEGVYGFKFRSKASKEDWKRGNS